MSNPSLEKLIQLAELLDSKLDYLLTGDSNDQVTLHDTRLAKRFKELDDTIIITKQGIPIAKIIGISKHKKRMFSFTDPCR